MAVMGRQQLQRLKAWRTELKRHLCVPVIRLAFEGFVTMERLTREEAEQHDRTPFPPGTAWGACWEYGWFFADVEIPESLAGQRLILRPGLGAEQLVHVNGQCAGSIDREHAYVTLSRSAQAHQRFHLAVEAYAGHGARLESLGPCPPERTPLPEVPDAQCVIAASTVECWNEDAYQLFLDVETLCGLLEVLPETSLRAMKVAEALDQWTHIVDFELPMEERNRTFREARAVLAPAMACHNGTTAPLYLLIGQSHIDLGWLWPVEETIRKVQRTYGNQLALMEEYPEYRFLACEPALLEMLRQHAPAQWASLLEAFRRGQIIPDGAFYVECDTNLPSGESLVRQLMWGKRWFREEFGVESCVAWQPDTFGFSGALPQLLRGFGIPYFATQKLLRADPEYPRFPYQNFIWEGIDGSEVQALSFFKSNAVVDPASFARRWETDRTQRDAIDTLLYPFGYGDGGGGATRDLVEMASRLEDLEGLPRSRYGSLQEYFELSRGSAQSHRWVGELYLQWHRGTYTAQRRAKTMMRRLQELLHDVEMLLSSADPGVQAEFREPVREAWEVLLFHQFHDIAAGVCIERVHREQTEAFRCQIEKMTQVREQLISSGFRVRQEEDGYTLFNPLPWPVTGWVRLPDGRQVYQTLPAGGAVNCEETECPGDVKAAVTETGFELSNAWLRARITPDGRVASLVTLEDGQEFAGAEGLNDWQLYRQVEPVYDAWEMSRDAAEDRCRDAFRTHTALTLNTPQRAEVTVERAFSGSTSVQTISLEASSRMLVFRTAISWHERHRMLKVHFHTNILCRDAVHEIQFGSIRRPAHRSDAGAAAQYEVCQQRYTALHDEGRGLSLLNDGIYGISCDRAEMALTLLRAPLVPDPACDRGEHSLSFALLPYSGAFADSGTVRAAYAFNQPPVILKGRCTEKEGIRAEGAVLETVKPAEDGNGQILRLYEPYGRSCSAHLQLPEYRVLTECGLSEEEEGCRMEGKDFRLTFRPFQIRTFRAVQEPQR